jgi:predicted flap endonuclease-1-like 5' DNA nuclease
MAETDKFKRSNHMAKLIDVEGIGPVYASKIKKAGVSTTEGLLRKGATPTGRKEIAKKAGVSEHQVLEWVNRVDLFRIKGVAEEYSDLLESAGVDTVVELAQRNAASLFEKMAKLNASKKVVRKLPSQSQIEDWIAQAKRLPRAVSY